MVCRSVNLQPATLQLLVFPFLALLAACEGSPMEPEVRRLPIGEVRAEFPGVEVELLKYNLSWFPWSRSVETLF